MTLDDCPDLLTLAEVAQVLRCSSAHVRSRVLADGLRCVSWGAGSRMKRVYKADLVSYIESKREAR